VCKRCSTEETDEQIESDVYNVPESGRLVYCGLQGFVNVLERERISNNLGHPMFQNLRQGDWMMSYVSNRLAKYASLQLKNRATLAELAFWLQTLFDAVAQLPRFLIPAYFDLVIRELYRFDNT
jgi:glycogen debranching enzyme